MKTSPPPRIDLFRLVHHANVAHILAHGLCNRGHANFDPNYVDIGLGDIIGKRHAQPVGVAGHGDLGDPCPSISAATSPCC